MKTELLFVAMPIRPSWGVGYIGVGQALLGKERLFLTYVLHDAFIFSLIYIEKNLVFN
jgi:hypothetical protein